jgi:hypothetical protein
MRVLSNEIDGPTAGPVDHMPIARTAGINCGEQRHADPVP